MMKKTTCTLLLLAATAVHAALLPQPIRIQTKDYELILNTAPSGRLFQTYFGPRLNDSDNVADLPWKSNKGNDGIPDRGYEPMVGLCGDDMFEPAIALIHNDGRQDTYLYYQDAQDTGGSVRHHVITLRDDRYPVNVTLHYQAYSEENVIVCWSEISHNEKKPVTLTRMASPILYLNPADFLLTHYHGDWAREGRPETTNLTFGKKILDTRMGSRAAEQCEPFFQLDYDDNTILGIIAWTGNFRLTFEIDNAGALRIVPAINPMASNYILDPGHTFRTPDFIYTISRQGADKASRQIHDWARKYRLKDGMGNRMTLLNNWENTYFNFNQQSLATLMQEAKDLGVDMFLLDDGWFGNKHPRNDDHAGLGDWQANSKKIPDGIPGMLRDAQKAGVKFGIWIEPEMVNPRSELFEKHPDWALHYPDRNIQYHRNQLVLDLANPKVQDHVYGVVDNIMQQKATQGSTEGHVAYFKWDCNAMITSPYSAYLRERQGNLYIDHVRGLYAVLDRIRQQYPDLPMMLCSGGGGRCDYKMLEYFTEFWPSDNTDPFERLHIQWTMSKFFPVKALAAHVTNWNRQASMKFRVDVASMCKLGFDINLANMPDNDKAFCRQAVRNWNRMKPVILDGDLYHLISPYDTPHMAVNYVSKDRSHAVLFAYDLHPRTGDPQPRVFLQGLDADATYSVTETNLAVDAQQPSSRTYTGRYLMEVGLDILSASQGHSRVFELNRE